VPTFLDERQPLYLRIRDDLAARIAAGEWRPGDAIPAEDALAEHHGVALGTVRKAIDELVRAGMIERRQGRGSFVRRSDFGNAMLRFFRHTDAQGRPLLPSASLLERRVEQAPPEIAAALGLAAGAPILMLFRLRSNQGEPILAEDIALPLPRFEALADWPADEFGDLLYPFYEKVCGAIVARARERISFGYAQPRLAAPLGLDPGAPIVVIERTALGYDAAPLEWRRSYGAAERFSYTIDIQ
jgi:GntR family transcriptional regulator